MFEFIFVIDAEKLPTGSVQQLMYVCVYVCIAVQSCQKAHKYRGCLPQ